MTDPIEPFRAWQEAIRQLSAAAATPGTGQSELTRQLLAPLERQGELLEQSLQRQAAVQQEVVSRMFAPVDTLVGVLEETSAAMRTQAQTFDAAAESLKRAGEALELQAGLLDRASRSMREPADLIRSGGLTGAGGAPRAGTNDADPPQ